ncbi:Xaa-Pro aminopeptidase [Legionella jordanis]|uniref:Xaa-Pro aminopeptidase n=1 Tax=Legionella jordanis TaxID=456 RepID=A0A0W0VCR4_9GAMM|nr:Xaa-Pro aminopeptidase [Legionella jordanis]KTD17898.1 Xaa-Pro aminopeptidase [Legionella jordanis]RMX02403.1 Xaa-Pro aminopeptidase [Legionella jordanis]VEH14011.1 Xaa-Pro aminopeptidase [Legionella jordanis]HAT8713868.1 Xaa-Pro aminopeptidase [Legionella jordanis]
MITKEEYQARRKKLAKQLHANAVAIIPAASEALRSGDSHYRFRQDSDFYYLTGFNEPEAMLVIFSGPEGESYLFNRPHDAAQEQWTGRRLGQEAACEVLGVNAAFSIHELETRLGDLLAGKSALYYALGRYPAYEDKILNTLQRVKGFIRRGIKAPEAVYDLEPVLSEMRLFKSEAEIALMRKAAEISVLAHKRAMRACRDAHNEYQLEAELIYEFSRGGCRSVAYDPIVASGANSCILHYTENNQNLHSGDLLLIDAGGEYANYAADITRTFPINGRFNAEQRAIYELVLKAQRAGIAAVKPGLRWNEVQRIIVRVLTEGLCELGILKGDIDRLISGEAYKPFYMHNSGHWLGLDVHDAGRYKIDGEWRSLEPGMVLTVEPGIYITANMAGVDERWWNIGVRIEDDILVCQDGHENLTAALPVDVEEIEALVRG